MASNIGRGLGVVFAKGRTVSVWRGFGNDFLKMYYYVLGRGLGVV